MYSTVVGALGRHGEGFVLNEDPCRNLSGPTSTDLDRERISRASPCQAEPLNLKLKMCLTGCVCGPPLFHAEKKPALPFHAGTMSGRGISNLRVFRESSGVCAFCAEAGGVGENVNFARLTQTCLLSSYPLQRSGWTVKSASAERREGKDLAVINENRGTVRRHRYGPAHFRIIGRTRLVVHRAREGNCSRRY